MNSHGQTDSRLSERVVLYLEFVFGAVVPIAIIVLIFLKYNSKQDLYGLSTIPSEELYDPGSTTIGRLFYLTGRFFLGSTSFGFVPLLIPFLILGLSTFALLIQIIYRIVNPFIAGIILSANLIYIVISVISVTFLYQLFIYLLVSLIGEYFFQNIAIFSFPILLVMIIFFKSTRLYVESIKKIRSKTVVFGAFWSGFILSVILSIGINSIVKIYAEREVDRLINLSIGRNQVQVIELTNSTWLRPPLSWSIDVDTIIAKRYIESGRDHGIGQLYRVIFGLPRSLELDRIRDQ